MRIVYTKEDPVFDSGRSRSLEDSVREFLAAKGMDYPVYVDGGEVSVEYPDDCDGDADEDERIVASFCRDHRFIKAEKVVHELIEKRPWGSEGYRLLAQIEMEAGKTEAAIEHARDAVRFNPHNLYALTLLGNLLTRDKGMPEGGVCFARRAYELYPDSAIAVNNYAGTLMQLKDADKGELERLFRKAISIDPSYMNPYYGLTRMCAGRGDVDEAFKVALDGLRKGTDRPENSAQLRDALSDSLVGFARELADHPQEKLVEETLKHVEEKGGRETRIEEDASLNVPARMELAENHGRDWNRLVVKASVSSGIRTYYIVHELEKYLMRLESAEKGREASLAMTQENRKTFMDKTQFAMSDRFRSSLPQGRQEEFLGMMADGVGAQIMNCPLDILVARRLFEKYPQLHPHEVVAAVEMAGSSIGSVRAGVRGQFPKNIVRINRTLNAVTFMSYRDLFGLDLMRHLDVPDDELKQAREMYGACCANASLPEPGDEWSIIRSFVEKLHLVDCFTIVETKRKLEEESRKEESTREFQKNFSGGKNPGVNMAVTMHMVDAIRRLKSMASDEVRKIAVEIAMIGTSGISPDRKSGYLVRSLGGEDMSGCRLLAYYYVSWKFAFPEKVSVLGLPFEKEYRQAYGLSETGM